MTTSWESGEKDNNNCQSMNKEVMNQELWKQAPNKPAATTQTTTNTISDTTLSSWSRQQRFAMIGGFAMVAILLAVCACTKETPKPALVGVSSPSPQFPVEGATPQAAATASAVTAPAAAKKIVKKRPANVTYSDPNSGISFLYPRRFTLATGDKSQPSLAATGNVPMNFVEPGGVTVVTVKAPDHLYPGTDFESAFFTVSLNRNVSEEQCGHFAFVDTSNADGEPVDAEKVRIGSTEMEKTSDFTANIMKQAETQYYHKYENGTCYEYVLGLGTEGFATVGGIEHVDRDEIFAKLEKILSTVKVEPVSQPDAGDPAPVSVGGGKE